MTRTVNVQSEFSHFSPRMWTVSKLQQTGEIPQNLIEKSAWPDLKNSTRVSGPVLRFSPVLSGLQDIHQ